jgi:L-alanine-DL-glutamate epimerase-like enolase superfamily enzyme
MDGFDGYAGLFIGTDPLRIARPVRTLDQIAVHAGRYWPLEAALWDIAGKACGQPVATLFGGASDKLACYASFAQRRSPAEQVEAVLAARDAGVRDGASQDHRRGRLDRQSLVHLARLDQRARPAGEPARHRRRRRRPLPRIPIRSAGLDPGQTGLFPG